MQNDPVKFVMDIIGGAETKGNDEWKYEISSQDGGVSKCLSKCSPLLMAVSELQLNYRTVIIKNHLTSS